MYIYRNGIFHGEKKKRDKENVLYKLIFSLEMVNAIKTNWLNKLDSFTHLDDKRFVKYQNLLEHETAKLFN